jgi:hypothetical protein
MQVIDLQAHETLSKPLKNPLSGLGLTGIPGSDPGTSLTFYTGHMVDTD